jgi:ABC-type nitrate/sulfonate/bicarbonate transport system substrate-binding protein
MHAYSGIQAKRAGYDFKTFRLGDYDIPYGYSPCIAYNADSKSVNTKAYKAFLTATGKGYLAAARDTESASAIVQQAMIHDGIKDEKATDIEFLKASQKAISDYYNITDGAFGHMQSAVWEKFVDFLKLKNLLKSRDGEDASVDARALYTNSLLEAHEV